jgi:16S rRNA (guanine527-N7)-methyltransferase|tara:strand:+ start:1123 stop:1740 length:618 start_codon:yes stop_codon:yes gene_type:complete
MEFERVKDILLNQLNFTKEDVDRISFFHDELLNYNRKYNLISKSTENNVWERHILDSAQITKFIDIKSSGIISDLGSGGGFPGIIIAIFTQKSDFHVKLYEKSSVKRIFLQSIIDKMKLNAKVVDNIKLFSNLYSNYIVCRAFKKIPEILAISREIFKKPHKIIILKGKNAQIEINKVLKLQSLRYKMESSITDKESKIIIIDVK